MTYTIIGFSLTMALIAYLIYRKGKKDSRLEILKEAYEKRDKIESVAKEEWDNIDVDTVKRRAIMHELLNAVPPAKDSEAK